MTPTQLKLLLHLAWVVCTRVLAQGESEALERLMMAAWKESRDQLSSSVTHSPETDPFPFPGPVMLPDSTEKENS